MRICICIFILLCSSRNFIIYSQLLGNLNATENPKYLVYQYFERQSPDVYWNIISEPSTTINLTLVESTLEETADCSKDYLHMHDHRSPVNKKMCGSLSISAQSATNGLALEFHSGDSSTKRFKLRYRAMRHCNLTTVPHREKYVVEGDRLILSCTSDCPSPVRYSWFHLGYKSGVDAYLSVDKPDGNLTINQTTRNQYGLYICTASHYPLTDDDAGYSASRLLYIEVHYGPDSSMSLTSDKSAYNEGQTAVLTCNADCKPDCTYNWTSKGNVIKTSNTFTKPVKLEVSNLTRNNVYTCIAINTKIKKTFEKNIALAVYYGPDNSTSITGVGRKFAVAGENYSLVCVADCFPACLYGWSFDSSHLIQPYSSNGILTIKNVRKNDGAIYTCFARNSETASTGKKTFEIEVFYQPIIENFQMNNQSLSAYVNEKDRVDVICNVDSKPASTIELRNNTNQIKVVHNSTRIQFAWKEASCEDSIIYFCTADNSVKERVKKQIELFVYCHPRLNYHESFRSSFTEELGNDAVLHISVIAFPPPVFAWYKLVNGQWKLLKQTEPVQSSSWSSVGQLILYKTKREDAGDYQVVVSSKKFIEVLVKKMKLDLTDSTQDMKTVYLGVEAGGAVLFVVVVIILVFVLIRNRRATSKKMKRETDTQPTGVLDADLQRNRKTGNENLSADTDADYDYLEMETDADLQRNRKTGNENLSADTDADYDCFEMETGSTKRDKNTLDEDYLVPRPPESYAESGSDNKELTDSYSKLESGRRELDPYDKIRRD